VVQDKKDSFLAILETAPMQFLAERFTPSFVLRNFGLVQKQPKMGNRGIERSPPFLGGLDRLNIVLRGS